MFELQQKQQNRIHLTHTYKKTVLDNPSLKFKPPKNHTILYLCKGIHITLRVSTKNDTKTEFYLQSSDTTCKKS